MLDSPERVCAGQVQIEYPATSVLFSNWRIGGDMATARKTGDARPQGVLLARIIPGLRACLLERRMATDEVYDGVGQVFDHERTLLSIIPDGTRILDLNAVNAR